MKQIIFITIITILFIGCGSESKREVTQWGGDPYAVKVIDYYEISNDVILHTSINDEYYNYSMLVRGYMNSEIDSISSNSHFIEDYNLTNVGLGKDETFYAWNFYHYNTFTNKSLTTVTKEYFGLYEVITNYCLINHNDANCSTYIYFRDTR